MKYENGEFVSEPGDDGEFIPEEDTSQLAQVAAGAPAGEIPEPPASRAESKEPLSPPVLRRLEFMSGQLGDIAGRLAVVAAAGRKTRQLTIGQGVSLVANIALTVVAILLVIGAVSANSALHQSQLTACGIGNQTRTEQRALWAYLEQQHAVPPSINGGDFLAYIDKTFADVNCMAVYHK